MNLGWIFLGIIILIIIIVVIIIIVKNRNNTLNLLLQLPNYRILYPANETYLRLLNVPSTTATSIPLLQPFWVPVLSVGATNTDTTGVWKIDIITDSTIKTTTNQKIVKMINLVMFFETPNNSGDQNPDNLGFVDFQPILNITDTSGQQSSFVANPNTTLALARELIYTDLGNNSFTLHLPNEGNILPVIVTANNFIIASVDRNVTASIFKLQLT